MWLLDQEQSKEVINLSNGLYIFDTCKTRCFIRYVTDIVSYNKTTLCADLPLLSGTICSGNKQDVQNGWQCKTEMLDKRTAVTVCYCANNNNAGH